MKTKRILFGGVAGGIAFFFIGWLVYGILLRDFAEANYNQSISKPDGEMVWWALILSNLAYGFLFSYVFSLGNIRNLKAGAMAGAILGLLMALSVDLGMYSMNDIYLGFFPVVVDVLVYVVLSAVIGMIVAYFMGLVKENA